MVVEQINKGVSSPITEAQQCDYFPPHVKHGSGSASACSIGDAENKVLVQAMHQFSKDLMQYDVALYEIVQFASQVFDANCQIRLFNESRDELILSAIHDQNPHIFQEKHISLDDFTLSRINEEAMESWLEKSIPLIISDATAEDKVDGIQHNFWPFEDQRPLTSLIVVPLFVSSNLLGILILIRHTPESDCFSNQDLCFACNLAGIAASAIHIAQNYEKLQRQLAVQEREITKTKDSEQRFRQVFESAVDAIFICQLDGIIIDINPAVCETYGYARDELINQEISIISFDYLSLNFSEDKSDLSEYDGEPFECLTRQKNGQSIYTEVIVQPFSHENTEFFQINARDISERVQTQNKLKTQMNHLHAIRAIDLVMKNSAELQSILEFILNQIKLELEVDAVALLLFNEEENRLKCISAQGFKANLEKIYAPQIEHSFSGRIVKDRKIIYKNNLDEQEANSFPAFLINENLRSYCAVPLLINEKVKGIIETFSRDKFDLTYDWINYLETLAGHAAIAIENYQLFNGLRQSNMELIQAYDATIAGWSRALDLRDNDTVGHTERVTEMTVLLAMEAGFPEEEIVHIRRGAMLHDIGKIGIPDRILLKPAKLDEDEWKIMKEHPQYAYDMLCDIEYLRPALDIPLYHHEKWDGTGYPQGLEGEDIPYIARLFAVVDVWDALRSDRPYRESWLDERVYAYIKEKNGLHFDPKAVEIFLRVVKKDVILHAKDHFIQK